MPHLLLFKSWRFAPLVLLPLLGACSETGLALGTAATLGIAASQERGFATAVQDEAIWLDIKARLFAADVSLFADVKAEVLEHSVLLTGDVPTGEARVEALRLVWSVPGVEKVIDELEIREDGSLVDLARDTWITAQLESRLLLDSQVDALNYAIETVNQTVFLLGIARDRDELERVIGWAKSLSYVRQVVSYVRLKGEAPPWDSTAARDRRLPPSQGAGAVLPLAADRSS